MKNISSALIIIALIVGAVVLILTDHPFWALVVLLMTGIVKWEE